MIRPALAFPALGAVAALGLAPVSQPYLTVVALGAAFHLSRAARSPRQAAWRGWLLGLGYFAVALHWIVEPFLVDVARHGWMAPFALVLLAGGLALFWGGSAALAHWLAPGRGARAAIAWAVALAAAELTRSYIFSGFPWALLGHVWIGWAPMQLARLAGPHGLTLLTLLVPALCCALWPRRAGIAPLLAAAGALYAYALILDDRPGADGPSDQPDRALIRLVQPNAPQHLKWHPDHARGFYERAVDYTAADAPAAPSLIIWPETSVPALLENAGGALDRIAHAAGGIPVVLGIQRRVERRYYNSLVHLGADEELRQIYDKHHLVPFGEYIPAGDLLARVGVSAFAAQAGNGYSAGPGPELLDFGALGRAVPLICYEAIFPQHARTPERPDWILQITNDAWFGNWVGPYQHLAQAQLRAVEQGLPLVRVANTGVSAVIDARGRVVAALPLNTAGYLDAALPPARPPTLYARTGDWPATALFLVVLVAFASTRRQNRH